MKAKLLAQTARTAAALIALSAYHFCATSSQAATGQLYAAGYFSAGLFENDPDFALRAVGGNPPPGNTVGISTPTGGLILDSHFWIAAVFPNAGAFDSAYFNKLTFDPALGIAELGPYDGIGTPGKPGQPAFDPLRSIVYIPDNKSKVGGVYRYVFIPGLAQYSLSAGVFNLSPGVALAPSAGLDGPRPQAVALGPDGQLYVGFDATGDIRRINNPAGTTQTVQTIGKSSKGNRVLGLAFVGNDLYLAEKDGLSVIHNATSCNSGCVATVMPHSLVGQPHLGITTDGVDTIYVAVNDSVMRYSISTQSQVLYANSGAMPNGTIVPFMMGGRITSVVLDSAGNLFVGDDASGATINFYGREWLIPAGSSPVQ
jgi:hypothetical protein